MKVSKSMINPELQKGYALTRLLPNITRHKWGSQFFSFVSRKANQGKIIDGLDCSEQYISSNHGGRDIRVKIYRPKDVSTPLPAMVYIHGGGYAVGLPEEYHAAIKAFIERKPCIIVAPDYRKSLEEPYPAAFNDCYDTLLWLKDNAERLGAVADKFIVGGHSAGGGLTAAVVQKATDTGDVNIAFQMPIYPMIDNHQNTPSAVDNNAPVWDSHTNRTGWRLYLQGLSGDVPAYAAAARAVDVSKLPPTISFVGDIEPFYDETKIYMERLAAAGVETRFKVLKGAFHGFEMLFPKAQISLEANGFLLDSYQEFVERFFE